MAQDVGAIGYLDSAADLLLDDQHRRTVIRCRPDGGEQPLDHQGGVPERKLVREQGDGFGSQRTREREDLLLPCRRGDRLSVIAERVLRVLESPR